jgi:hypothetical protein
MDPKNVCPNEKPSQECRPAPTPTRTNEEGRYLIKVEGFTDVDKFKFGVVFINHNASGSFLPERIKERFPNVRWHSTVRAPRSRVWQVEVHADQSPKNQLVITCQIEILGGPNDGLYVSQPQVSLDGGLIVCIKPIGL